MNIRLINSLAQIVNSLTEEERKVLESKLSHCHHSSEIASSNFQDEPFIGMWNNREDITDSSQWVRQIRQQQWMN
jgi:hypothetical protein